MSGIKSLLLFAIILFVVIGCSSHRTFTPPPPLPDDTHHVPDMPEIVEVNVLADGFDRQIIQQGTQAVDLGRQWRNLFGPKKQAMNVDAFGNVPNSSWFINRNGVERMSLEEIARGPNVGDGPDTSDVLTVIRAKTSGLAPGFQIQDRHGNVYIIKFDPVGYLESSTGTEVVITKIMHAAGYNVPQNYVFYFHPRMLQLGDNVKFTDSKGRKRLMVQDDLDAIIGQVEHLPDGFVRAHASKFIDGVPIGPFRFRKTREDDPNDFVPHQHRRELRGLRVLFAWVNNYDTNAGNMFDAYVTENGRSYVKHFLIDFGSAMGGYIYGPMPPTRGVENYIDPQQLALNSLSFGLYVHPWERNWRRYTPVQFPSIGYFILDGFDPHRYKFTFPNEAFENMTYQDGYWAARIVMSFTDEQLEAIVANAHYSDPDARAYMVGTLAARRDIIGRYYFSRVNPLDNFELQDGNDDRQQLHFDDIAVETGLESADQARYRYEIRRSGDQLVSVKELGNRTIIQMPSVQTSNRTGQWEVILQTTRGTGSDWSKRVYVYLEADDSSDQLTLLGVRREE
ncbi:MAG: hypothetical protein P9M15_05110 [Candidatus Electryoneaceae bacterium]|nr:hypothetical protein [Candidatus Electryoneaceae bacterium]